MAAPGRSRLGSGLSQLFPHTPPVGWMRQIEPGFAFLAARPYILNVRAPGGKNPCRLVAGCKQLLLRFAQRAIRVPLELLLGLGESNAGKRTLALRSAHRFLTCCRRQ